MNASEQVRQQSVEARAALEIAAGGGDLGRIQAERNARRARAQSVLSDIEQELVIPQSPTSSEKRITDGSDREK